MRVRAGSQPGAFRAKVTIRKLKNTRHAEDASAAGRRAKSRIVPRASRKSPLVAMKARTAGCSAVEKKGGSIAASPKRIVPGAPSAPRRAAAQSPSPRASRIATSAAAARSHQPSSHARWVTWGSVALSVQKKRGRMCPRIWYEVEQRWYKAAMRPSPNPTPAAAAARARSRCTGPAPTRSR
jgi:hypothetical protein